MRSVYRYFTIARALPGIPPLALSVMSSKAQDHVHRLIHSMSRAEKRYFTLHNKRHSTGSQIDKHLLFEAIAEMEVYDEAALLERFNGQALAQRFAVTKRRFYESILRSLEAFYAEASLDARLNRSLHQVRILYDRALYDDAAKLLQGVKRSARDHERRPILFAAMEWEQKLAERDNYAHTDEAQLELLVKAHGTLLAEQEELNAFWELKSRLFQTLYRKGKARDTHTRSTLSELLASLPIQQPEQARCARSRFLYHHIHSAAAFALNDLEKCHLHLAANRALLEDDHRHFAHEPTQILAVLSNQAFVCAALGKTDEAMLHLQAFRTAPSVWNMPENEDLELKLFSTSYSLEMSIQLQLGKCEGAMALVPVISRGLKRYGLRLGPIRRAGFHYQLAYACMLAGQPNEALHWTNRSLNELNTSQSNELEAEGRLLYLAVLFETGKTKLLVYALRNTERFLKDRGQMQQREANFMALMRTLAKANEKEAQERAFQSYLVVMAAMPDSMENTHLHDHFDACAWAGSKLTAETFAQVIHEKAERQRKAA